MSNAELIEINANQLSPKSFSVDVEKVKKTVETFSLMQVNGIDDKKGLKALRDARLELRRIRIDIEKRGKQLRDDSNAYSKRVIQVEKELVALVAPTEELLGGRENAVENEIKAIAAAKLKARMDQLTAYQSVIPATAIEPMSEKEFAECLEYSRGVHEKRQEDIRIAKEAEDKRRADEAAEKAAEAKQLQSEREVLEDERRRLEELRKAQEAIQAAEQSKLQEERNALAAETHKLAEAQRKADAEAAEQRRQQELERARQEAAEQARKDEAARIELQRIQDAAVAEDARLEAIRQESLKPDREKLLKLADDIEALQMPEVSAETQGTVDIVRKELKEVARLLRRDIDSL